VNTETFTNLVTHIQL